MQITTLLYLVPQGIAAFNVADVGDIHLPRPFRRHNCQTGCGFLLQMSATRGFMMYDTGGSQLQPLCASMRVLVKFVGESTGWGDCSSQDKVIRQRTTKHKAPLLSRGRLANTGVRLTQEVG